MKVYCSYCKDFTVHNFRKPFIPCDRCRGRGNPIGVGLFISAPIVIFIYAVYRLWQGGGW